MQRVHAEHRRAARRRQLDELAQVAEVADAPVALRAHAVELHHEAPHPRAALEQLGLVAAPLLELHLRGAARRTERPRQRLARRRVDPLLAPPDVAVAVGYLIQEATSSPTRERPRPRCSTEAWIQERWRPELRYRRNSRSAPA